MNQHIPSTKAGYDLILDQANRAFATGNDEEGYRLVKQLPLPKHLAKAAVDLWGEEYLQSAGFMVEEVGYADLPER
jgi:hypothetical protein